MTLPDFVRQIALAAPCGGHRGLEDLPSESDLGMALGPLDWVPGPSPGGAHKDSSGRREAVITAGARSLPLGLGLNPLLAPAVSSAPELPAACRLVAAI